MPRHQHHSTIHPQICTVSKFQHSAHCRKTHLHLEGQMLISSSCPHLIRPSTPALLCKKRTLCVSPKGAHARTSHTHTPHTLTAAAALAAAASTKRTKKKQTNMREPTEAPQKLQECLHCCVCMAGSLLIIGVQHRHIPGAASHLCVNLCVIV
jgi:hypothetical protein